MPLEHNGLVKLSEECGELVQAAMKKIARSDGSDIHWDGSNLKERLEDEIADVLAACTVVQKYESLDYQRIESRTLKKVALFNYWHDGGTETAIPTVTLYFNGKPFETTLKSMTGEEILEQAKRKGLVEQWQQHRESIGRLVLVEELPNGTNRIIGQGDEIGLGFTRKFSAIDGNDNA